MSAGEKRLGDVPKRLSARRKSRRRQLLQGEACGELEGGLPGASAVEEFLGAVVPAPPAYIAPEAPLV